MYVGFDVIFHSLLALHTTDSVPQPLAPTAPLFGTIATYIRTASDTMYRNNNYYDCHMHDATKYV